MKNIIKIFTLFLITFAIFSTSAVNAWVDWLETIQWINNITEHSLNGIAGTWDIQEDVKNVWFSILTMIKYIISWLLVIFMVYIWIQMVISMWTDEDKLSTSKRQLWYTLVWLVFINIPWTVYSLFIANRWAIDGNIHWTWTSQLAQSEVSIFINTKLFDDTINWWIVMFIETAIIWIAIFMIILSGIKIMTARWREEQMTEAKNKILWSLVWLIFVWFIEGWQSIVYTWSISDWANLFETLENLALFFAGPVAIFFLTLAWYYYITSNGDEERVKKAKSIVINTIIATIILLASYAFLKDLITLTV